jgi:hypothetical protein
MRIFRPRFTLGWLMMLVALIGVGVWGWRLWDLRAKYLVTSGLNAVRVSVSINNSKKHSNAVDHLSRLIFLHDDIQYALANERRSLARSNEEIEYFTRLKLKYERAARYPWLTVEPDPPLPP